MMLQSEALELSASRTRDRVIVVEDGPPNLWLVSVVDTKIGAVIRRATIEASPLKKPGVRCIQKLGERLLSTAGMAGSILILLNRLCPAERLAPNQLTSYPVPMLAVSPGIGAALSAPAGLERFVLIDFSGRGAIALVKRGSDGQVVDYTASNADLKGYLGMGAGSDCGSGDLLDDWTQCSAPRPALRSPARLKRSAIAFLRGVRPLLDSARSFGYGAIFCASRLFSHGDVATAFLRAVSSELGSHVRADVVAGEDARAISAARHLKDARRGPGTWESADDSSRTLSVIAPRRVEYSVTHIGRPVFDVDEPALADLLEGRPTMFVIDKSVDAIYGEALREYARRHLVCRGIVPIDGAEAKKTWPQVEEICASAIRNGLRRDGVIAAIGGGVTLDTTGVAASLYRRGVRFVRIPTTLLGMVDVCVGIKQGINFGTKKNILGAFYPPMGGINDLSFLSSVSRRQLACGVAETVKMAIVRDPMLFALMEAHTGRLLDSRFQFPKNAAEQIVIRAELAMMNELQPNLFEVDLRRLVDFGHSFSPALESASEYQIHHGEAVAIDMMLCAVIAARRGMCDEVAVRRIADIYATAGLPLVHDLCEPRFLHDSLADIVIHRGGDLNLVVPTGIGSATFIQDTSRAEISGALDHIRSIDAEVRERNGAAYACAGS
jgi:3-dehydroquinate synthetase